MERMDSAILGKTVHVVVDRPIGYRHGDLVYPVNYGYIPGMMAADGEEQDAYILGIDRPLETFDGQVIGIIRRKNDVEDKLVVAPAGTLLHQGQIAQATHFQEQYFTTSIQCLLERSCGVLPWREEGGEKRFLIVLETYSRCWSLPKGHMEAGETEEQTALRELEEETGLQARLDCSLSATIEYPIGHGCRKQVVFFPGLVEGDAAPGAGEIDRCKWVTAQELERYLFPDTVAACKELLSKLP